jgi:hypothetical protein
LSRVISGFGREGEIERGKRGGTEEDGRVAVD